MRTLCWLALLTILSACASKPTSNSVSAEWDYIARAADRSSTIYVEGTSIRKLGGKVKLWEMLDYEEVRQLGSKEVLSFKNLKEHDCMEKKYRGLSVIFMCWNSHSDTYLGGDDCRAVFGHKYKSLIHISETTRQEMIE